ncbi:coiled-coil domain-containing protein 33 [Falco biarmicus]|uniref:coiled-coil domain-containing protein 33 n=1 Tax=Falco biarmicus TaxID=345155 RepID=UPI0024BBFF4C|nr:coiled-coil domain-containing protein 33 [Falco biarmicus]
MAGKAREPLIPLTLQCSQLKAEEKTLDFEFEVVSAQFNRRGCYALRLTVENPLLQGSGAGVQLRINSGEVMQSSTAITDTIEQSNLNQIHSFQRRKFTFTLPRGFCKNDKNHDVRLHIEALHFPRRAERMSRQVGRAFFAIYPRPNQPRMKLSARKDEDWYRYSAVMALLRVGSEQPAMHCGRLAFTASLHEHQPPTMLASPPPLSSSAQKRDQQAAGTAPASPALGILVPNRSLRTAESAYHSLPTEGHTRSLKRLQADPALSSSPELLDDLADEHPSSSSSSSSVPAPAVLSHSSFHLSSPGYSPDLASSPAQVSKSPTGMEEPEHVPVAGEGHVARLGKEAITVTLHSASNLPTTQEGRVPCPYVVVKTSRGDEQEQKPKATRATSVPTHTPTWEEEVTVEIDAEDAGWAALTLIVADKATKEALGTFHLPVRHLQPFQPHHCKLVLPRTRDPVGTVLHTTIIRKGSFIPRCDGFSYAALEVLLRGLSAPLASPPGALVAVARVVTNVQEYKHRMEKHPISCPGISPATITFPDPPASAFSIARAANHGYPQMSRPAGPPEQPTWNTSFLFQGRDVATIFSEDTALAIEYYPYKTMWDAPGTLVPVGYSVLPLTSHVFQELAAQSGGMRVDGLAVQGTDLKTTTGATPTVGLCLQLLRSERPAAFLPLSGSGALPSLEPTTASMLRRGEELPPAPVQPFYCQLHQDNVSLPGADSVASILPGKQPFPRGTGALAGEQRSQEIIRDPQELVSARGMGGVGGSGGMGGTAVSLRQVLAPVGTNVRLLLALCCRRRFGGTGEKDGWMEKRREGYMDAWMDGKRMDGCKRQGKTWMFLSSSMVGLTLQRNTLSRASGAGESPGWPRGASSSALGWQEASGYRLALKRMAGDLLSLRQHVTSLEVENGHLRRSLATQEDLGHALLTDVDLDVMTREELLDRLTTLKRKLVASTAEMRRLKDRVQQLQNELIRKNDREKELVLLQRAHQQQQAALRRCQEKVARTKGLEETVRQQEKVIEVMERVLQEQLTGTGLSTEKPSGEALSEEVYTALLAENRRLREELARPHHHPPPLSPRPPALPGVFGGAEKLSLLARLEEAQARGRVLERQLEEAARRWGREKQELGTRLLEREHGFPHAPASNLPAIAAAPPRRPQTLDPLPQPVPGERAGEN